MVKRVGYEGITAQPNVVMPGLVPGIHEERREAARRGWPGQDPMEVWMAA
jgi:hypothetical protein